MITIYSAKKIITMNPARPEASHVAVRDGKILGAGSLEELAGWGEHIVDTQFADKILMPGFVEGHAQIRARKPAQVCVRALPSNIEIS